MLRSNRRSPRGYRDRLPFPCDAALDTATAAIVVVGGIPVIVDRVHQARVANALEPEWEARFEPRSYGFRPGRGCHDAIQAIFEVVKGRRPKRQWVLDADLAGAFDRIAHHHLMLMLGSFPARGMIRR